MIEHPELRVVPVRTPTLPPATHTNAYVLGRRRLTIIDPASPWPDEQARLAEALQADLVARYVPKDPRGDAAAAGASGGDEEASEDGEGEGGDED